jgi:hypothetical protein
LTMSQGPYMAPLLFQMKSSKLLPQNSGSAHRFLEEYSEDTQFDATLLLL